MSQPQSIDELTAYVSDITRRSLWIAVGLALGSVAIGQGELSLLWGVLLGAGFSIVKFRVRVCNLVKFASVAAEERVGVLIRGRIASYLLAAVAIALACAFEQIHTVAAIVSLFLVNAVVVLAARKSFPVDANLPCR